MVTSDSLGTHKSGDCERRPCARRLRFLGLTLKKPQMPPPPLVSAEPRGSSRSSGKVMGEAGTSPADMAGCWLSGSDATPETRQHMYSQLKTSPASTCELILRS